MRAAWLQVGAPTLRRRVADAERRARILLDATERDVCAKRLGVEGDLAPRELGPNALAEREQRVRAGAYPQPHHPRTTRRRKAAGPVELDVERGNASRGGLGCRGHGRELLGGRPPDERQRHVHELGLHASKRGKVRRAAERRLCDLGGEWERDEEPYPRRLEPCGVGLVRDKQRDEHDPEKTAEACERGDTKTLAMRDALPCVGDQSTHSDTDVHAACRMAHRERVCVVTRET